MSAPLDTALLDVQASASHLGISDLAAIHEKALELRLRHAFRLAPNSSLKEAQTRTYLEEMLGSPVPPGLEERVRPAKRGPRLDAGEYEVLEARQNFRCAVCGSILDRAARPHVDHMVPVSLGGSSEPDNLQLLCLRCNLGKSNALHWLMLNPFFTEEPHNVSARLAYCVLSRDRSRCTEAGCGETSRTSRLVAMPRVPVQRGGRLIFDNLRAVCEHHESELKDEWYRAARQKVNAVRMGLSL
jgi:hypothetical protein